MGLVLGTKEGTVKKTMADQFHEVRRNGLLAITLDASDELISAQFANKGDDIMLVTTKGQSIRFGEADVRAMGRVAAGVRGIKMVKGDIVIGAGIIPKGSKDAELVVIGSLGYGKKTPVGEYKKQGRGGSGIKTAAVTSKTGPVIAAAVVGASGEIVTISQKSQVIRTGIEEVPSQGRQTQGVRVMRLYEGDKIASFVVLEGEEGPAA